MSLLNLHGIGYAFLGRMILAGIDLSVEQGELVALVGPSGCGKSTLAQIAGGLTQAKEGRIRRGYQRHAMVFQEPALLPWATAAGNIDYALRLAGLRRGARHARIARAAKLVTLTEDDLTKYPVELSGGMRQRTAIARALAIQPDFIFFDEPFTALDVALRRRMQDIVIRTCASGALSGLFITHDLHEAARIAHRVVVMDTAGRGLRGARVVPGTPAVRSDTDIAAWVQERLQHDPAFAHIHDVDERQIA